LFSAAVRLRTQPLALAAHATPALLLKMDKSQCQKAAQPSRGLRVALAGSLVASVLAAHESQQAACAPKRKAGTAAATKKKAPGPALPAVQAAFNKDKTYQVEKLIASRPAEPAPAPALAAPAARKKIKTESYADIFSRPMEEPDDGEEEAPAAAPLETDLEKYLKLPQLPLTMPDGTPTDILTWWNLRDHSLPADPQSGRPEGLPRLARMARQYHNEPGSSAGAERLFSAASRAHHDLKGAMADNSLEHELLALANTD
jgi:hypothetical protein